MDKTNKLAIFYHVGQVNNWMDICNEQMALLDESGLLEAADFLHIGINGPFLMKSDVEKIKPVLNDESNWLEETPTMRSLLKFAEENDGYKILYMHTKGVTHYGDGAASWRRLMQYFCIEKWEEAISHLPEYDAVGTNYVEEHYWGRKPHFSGGFWWTTSEHVRTLDHTYLDSELRYDREFWIGSGGGKMFNLHGDGVQEYAREYPEQLYKFDTETFFRPDWPTP
jgi:hypothetical protein